jgi:cell wall assembly regulator SMI1
MTNLHIHVYIYNHDIEKLQVSLMYFCTAKNMEQFTSQLSVSFPNNNKSMFTGQFCGY